MSVRQSNTRASDSAARRRAIYIIRLAAGYLAVVAALVLGITCELASCLAWAVASDHNEVAASFGTVVLMAGGALGWRLLRSTIDKVSSMPYVPPVREQIAALAAESVLVRGSAVPIEDQVELLRAGPRAERCYRHEMLRACDE